MNSSHMKHRKLLVKGAVVETLFLLKGTAI